MIRQMGRRLARRTTYANIVSTLALLVAIGTGSAWAAATIGSAAIIDGSIFSRDVHDATLQGRDVRNNSLTGADIKESTLATVPTATSATNATNAATAATATNAAALGGATASTYVQRSGDTVIWLSPHLIETDYGDVSISRYPYQSRAILSANAPAPIGFNRFASLGISAPTTLYGSALSVKSARVCYSVQGAGGSKISSVELQSMPELANTSTTIASASNLASTTATCVDLAPAAPVATSQRLHLFFTLRFTNQTDQIYLLSAKLTLTPA